MSASVASANCSESQFVSGASSRFKILKYSKIWRSLPRIRSKFSSLQPINFAAWSTIASQDGPLLVPPSQVTDIDAPEVLPKTRPADAGIFRGLAHAGGGADEPFNSDIGALLPIAL